MRDPLSPETRSVETPPSKVERWRCRADGARTSGRTGGSLVLAIGVGAVLLAVQWTAGGVSVDVPVDVPVDVFGEPIQSLAAASPADDDFDGDGLSDQQEFVLGTTPYDPDSDGDGYSDGEELARQSDPLLTSSIPETSGVSASLTARGEGNKLQLVLGIHEPAGQHNTAAIRLGALASGRVMSVPIGRFIGISKVNESTGTSGSRVVTIEVPIHPGFVHAQGRVSFFLAAGSQRGGGFTAAAKVDVSSQDGILLLQRPVSVSIQSLHGQGGGAIRQPIPPSTTPSIPATWVAGSICFQRSTVVGGSGVVLLHQIIEADCLQGWDSYCVSDCSSSVGDTYETIDPSALLGG